MEGDAQENGEASDKSEPDGLVDNLHTGAALTNGVECDKEACNELSDGLARDELYDELTACDEIVPCDACSSDGSEDLNRSRSQSVESILTSKSYARNVPGLVRSLTKQQEGVIKCITERILDEVVKLDGHTIQLLVPVSSSYEGVSRYLLVISRVQDSPVNGRVRKEHAVLGLNVNKTSCKETQSTGSIESECGGDIVVAMALAVWNDMEVDLDGDGGLKIKYRGDKHQYLFKPINIQTLWLSHALINKWILRARDYNFYPHGPTHSWVGVYAQGIPTTLPLSGEWKDMTHLERQICPEKYDFLKDPVQRKMLEMVVQQMEENILLEDPEEVTALGIRSKLEEQTGENLKPYKHYLTDQVIKFCNQQHRKASRIFDYLYLGSEWNASNIKELTKNKISCIVNITVEIENFFPDKFEYYNVKLKDVEDSDLQRYWNKTYDFIKKAKNERKNVFVHCRMGVSRSAATVIAYIMKEYKMSLQTVLAHVKEIRPCVKPNPGFLQQLECYQGILDARHNEFWGTRATVLVPRLNNLSDEKLLIARWKREERDRMDHEKNGKFTDTVLLPSVPDVESRDEYVGGWLNQNPLPSSIPSPTSSASVLPVIAPGLLHEVHIEAEHRTFHGDTLPTDSVEHYNIVVIDQELLNCEISTPRNSPSSVLSFRSMPEKRNEEEDDMLADGPYSTFDDDLISVGASVICPTAELTQEEREEAVKEAYNSLPGRTRGNLTRMTSCQLLDSPVMSAVISKEANLAAERHIINRSNSNSFTRRTKSMTGERIKRKREEQRNSSICSTTSMVDIQAPTEPPAPASPTAPPAPVIPTKPKPPKSDPKPAKKQSDKPKKFKESKTWTQRHRICAGIKEIIRRLLAPSHRPHKHSAKDEIEDVTRREGVIISNNRNSMPVLRMQGECMVPERRCQSQVFTFTNTASDED